MQGGTGGLIWLNNTLHSQVIHIVFLLYWDMRKQNYSSASVTLRKPIQWEDCIIQLCHKIITPRCYTNAAAETRPCHKDAITNVSVFWSKGKYPDDGVKSQYFHQLCNHLLVYTCVTLPLLLYSLPKKRKRSTSKCLGKITLTKDVCIHLRNYRKKKWYFVCLADHFYFWG